MGPRHLDLKWSKHATEQPLLLSPPPSPWRANPSRLAPAYWRLPKRRSTEGGCPPSSSRVAVLPSQPSSCLDLSPAGRRLLGPRTLGCPGLPPSASPWRVAADCSGPARRPRSVRASFQDATHPSATPKSKRLGLRYPVHSSREAA